MRRSRRLPKVVYAELRETLLIGATTLAAILIVILIVGGFTVLAR